MSGLTKLSGDRDARLQRTQDWIEESVLIFGGSRITAVTVSEIFADGVHQQWDKGQQPESGEVAE